MYQYPSYTRRNRSLGSYFFPFLSIIVLGLIVILIFQIVDYFHDKRVAQLQNKAALSVAAGRVDIKIWGVDDWTTGFDGSILNEGDALRTGPGSRATLSLLNGSVIRLDAETEAEITILKSRDGEDEVALILKSGQIWLKRTVQEAVRTAFQVNSEHLEVNSLGTVFSVAKRTNEEAVRVLEGKVRLKILIKDSEAGDARIAETLEVALGQEVSLRQGDIFNLKNNKPVSFLALLSDEFRESEWYDWNRKEDASGGSAIGVEEAVKNQEEEEEAPRPVLVPQAGDVIVAPPPLAPPPEPLFSPLILTPQASERAVKSGPVQVSGTVSAATEKIEVTTFVSGKREAYLLQKYRPGSVKWSYLISSQYANLLPGENKYEFVAIDRSGKRTAPTLLTIILDQPREPADFSAPKVLRFNGGASSETIEESVKVEGTVGKGIFRVAVNDFILSQYVPNSGEWVYVAKAVYGNLKDGKNEYAVYGMDAEGRKTSMTKFTITKKPRPAEQAAAPPAAGAPPAGTPPSSETSGLIIVPASAPAPAPAENNASSQDPPL